MLFSAPANPNPLESLDTRRPEMHKNNDDRNFSSPLAERERRSTPGRHRRAGSGAAWPGGLGGSNRTESASGSGRQARWRTGWQIGWPIGGGGPGSGPKSGPESGPESGKAPAGFFVCFSLRGRRPAAAGALRALTGWIWGAGSVASRNIIEKKEIF